MVDQLSDGRLNMRVGTGSQALEAQRMGADYESRDEKINHNLDNLIRKWELASQGEISIESVNVAPTSALCQKRSLANA